MPRDTYLTLAEPSSWEPPKTRGSRFIAEAHPAGSADEAESIVDSIRRREHAATHHCYAYRMGPSGRTFRYNDDGEPSGTAGAPILRQLEARSLTLALVVVVRYYGGVKLGTGGLARAYGKAASGVLDRARPVERVLRSALRLRFDYEDTSPAMHTLQRFDAPVREAAYAERTELLLDVRRSEVRPLIAALTDALRGRGDIEAVEDDPPPQEAG